MKYRVTRPVSTEFPITSPFGMRIHPILKVEKMHNGIDFGCPVGTPIRAALAGKITRAGYENPENHAQGYGLRVWQECNTDRDSLFLVYAHLEDIVVSEGQWVDEGGLIGFSGKSGSATGPHLHFGGRIRDTNEYVDFEYFEDTIIEPGMWA